MGQVRDEWMQDPDFPLLPKEKQDEYLMMYFENQIVDDEFLALPQEEQNEYRDLYMESEGIGPVPLTEEELAEVPTSRGITQYDIETKEPMLPEPESLTDQLSRRFQNTTDYLNRKFGEDTYSDPAKEFAQDIIMGGVALGGQTALGVVDVLDQGVGYLYRTLTPEEFQVSMNDRLINFMHTKAGKMAMSALYKGSEAWGAFKERYPDAAFEIESMLGLSAGLAGGAQAKRTSQTVFRKMMDAGTGVISELGRLTPTAAKNKIGDITNRYFTKAVRPPKGLGKSYKAIEGFDEDVAESVYGIIADKDNLKLVDRYGLPLSHKIPENLDEFNQVISQRKLRLFDEYSESANIAGDKGLEIDISDLITDRFDDDGNIIRSPINEILQSSGTKLMDKDTIQRAQEIKEDLEGLPNGKMNVKEAQKAVQLANKLSSKSPGIDQMLANELRDRLNAAMDALPDSRYSEIKKQYGHLNAIEEVVSKAAFASRSTRPAFWRRAGIYSLGRALKGAAKLDFTEIASAFAEIASQEAIEKLYEPNSLIKKMFKKADDVYTSSMKRKPPEGDKLYSEFINRNLDNEIKRLEGRKYPQLERGAIRTRETGPIPGEGIMYGREKAPGEFEVIHNRDAKGAAEIQRAKPPKKEPPIRKEFATDAWEKTRQHKEKLKKEVAQPTSKPKPEAKPIKPKPKEKLTGNEPRKAPINNRDLQADPVRIGKPKEWKPKKVEDIEMMTSLGRKGSDYYWHDKVFNSTITTKSKKPEKVWAAIIKKREEFVKKGYEPDKIKPITKKYSQDKPMDTEAQKAWLEDLRKYVDEKKKED